MILCAKYYSNLRNFILKEITVFITDLHFNKIKIQKCKCINNILNIKIKYLYRKEVN